MGLKNMKETTCNRMEKRPKISPWRTKGIEKNIMGVRDDADLIEVTATTPIYYEGIGPVSIVDGMLHIVLWTKQLSLDRSGEVEKIVVARLMVRPDAVEAHRAVVDDAFRIAAEFCEGKERKISH